MGLLNLDPVQTNDEMNEEFFNSRFDAIADILNGNVDADNLGTGSVTTPKIANLAVTTAKVANDAITPSKLHNVWITPLELRGSALVVNTNETTIMEESFDLDEASYLLIDFFHTGNANGALDLDIRIYINDVDITDGNANWRGVTGLEIPSNSTNLDGSWIYRATSTDVVNAGTVTVKCTMKTDTSSYDVISNQLRVEAIQEDNVLSS